MNAIWKNALRLWWSYIWRLVVFTTLFGFVFTLMAMQAGVQPVVYCFVAFLVSFPISIFSLKFAVGRYVGNPQTWKVIIAIWWSLTWRLCLYAFPIALA